MINAEKLLTIIQFSSIQHGFISKILKFTTFVMNIENNKSCQGRPIIKFYRVTNYNIIIQSKS